MAAVAERLTGVPARFSVPVVQSAQGALIGTIGLYWDARRHAAGSESYWTAPHLLMLWGLEAAVITAALLHGALDGPRASGERPARGPRILVLVETLVVAGLVRLMAPGRPRLPRGEMTVAPGARLMLLSGGLAMAVFPWAGRLDG